MRVLLFLILVLSTSALSPTHMRRYPLPKAIHVEKQLLYLKDRAEGYINLKPLVDINSVKLLLRPSLADVFEIGLEGADGIVIPVLWDGVEGHASLGMLKSEQLYKLRIFVKKKKSFSMASISLVFQFEYPVKWATELVLANDQGAYSNSLASEVLIQTIQTTKVTEEISNFILTGNQF